MTETRLPTLEQCFATASKREAQQLVRALLGAARQFVDEGQPAPAELLTDLHVALRRDDLGSGLVREVARAVWNLTPDTERN